MRLAFSVLIPAALGLLACAGEERPRNLLVITLDTVRADALGHLGGRGDVTPRLDALAEEGVSFTDAWTPRGQTWPGLATLLTGKLPLGHGTRENGFPLAPGVLTMAEPLRRAGLRTGAFLTNACEAWGTERFDYLACTALPDERAGDQSRAQHTWDRRAVDGALEWIGDGAAPFFAWVHLYDAHRPYPTIPALRERFLDPGYRGPFRVGRRERARQAEMPMHDRVAAVARSGERPDETDLDALRAYYDAGVFGVDRQVGRLLGALAERRLLDDTLVVVAADHGEDLFDHRNNPYHGASMHGATLRVPLIVRWPPGVAAGRRVAEPVGLVDVMPTVFELFDVPAPDDLDGASLVPALRSGSLQERDQMTELVAVDLDAFRDMFENRREWSVPELDGELFAIRRGRWRLVSNPDGVAVREPPFADGPGLLHPTALYDLEADPGETRDVAAEHPEVVRELSEALDAWVERLAASTPRSLPPSPETVMTLHQLGYLGDPGR